MENASKALIIAGSVLVAILLIAMGVRVFTSTRGTTDAQEGAMKTTEVSVFNSKFTQYVGTNKSKAQVVALLNAAISNNATNDHKITVNGSSNIANLINTVGNGTYRIYVNQSDYDGNGYLTNIHYQ